MNMFIELRTWDNMSLSVSFGIVAIEHLVLPELYEHGSV
jgi:hypothetical protein